MWTYIIGPFLALLPKPWRKALSISSINWAHAITLSGFAELAIALAASFKWYLITMSTWVNRGLAAAMDSSGVNGISDQAVGGMAWFMWINQPLTWILGYFCVEGAVRMCGAAFSDALLGTLPLYLIDKTARLFFGGSKTAREVPGAASSFIGAVSERLLESSVPVSVDEIVYRQDGADELMEILSSRRKQDWEPPRVVRCGDAYYRLEDCSKCPGVRPFRYRLRRLAAGVPGRKVLLYEAGDAVTVGRR